MKLGIPPVCQKEMLEAPEDSSSITYFAAEPPECWLPVAVLQLLTRVRARTLPYYPASVPSRQQAALATKE